MLDEHVAVLLALDDALNRIGQGSDYRTLSPVQARRRMASQVHLVDEPAPPGVTTQELEAAGPAGVIPVRAYAPDGIARPSPGLVYLHGGGWTLGSVRTHDALCRKIAVGARCRVFSVDYRLAPEHRFPAALDDSLAAFRWVASRSDELGIDPRRLAVAGDSAGGNLSALVSRHAARDREPPALQVLLYPGTDARLGHPSNRIYGERYFLTHGMIEWFYDHYTGDRARRLDPNVSPLLAEDVRGLAPALVYTAGFDPLRDEGLAYADKLRAAGVRVSYLEFPTLPHGFAMMTSVAAAARALEEIIASVARELHGPA